MIDEIKTFDARKAELVKIGKEKGFITYEELANSLKGLDLDADSLDDLYNTFEMLYKDIEEINLYDEDDKDKYRLYNYSNYQELFDEENKTITWYSDETAREVANYLKIKKEEDCFILSFNVQEHIKGYDRDFSTPNYIPIRFRNSGSRYDPFNTIIMEMYERLQKIENKDENCHQITLEEYLNNLDKEKVLNKKRTINKQ